MTPVLSGGNTGVFPSKSINSSGVLRYATAINRYIPQNRRKHIRF